MSGGRHAPLRVATRWHVAKLETPALSIPQGCWHVVAHLSISVTQCQLCNTHKPVLDPLSRRLHPDPDSYSTLAPQPYRMTLPMVLPPGLVELHRLEEGAGLRGCANEHHRHGPVEAGLARLAVRLEERDRLPGT